MSLNGLLHKGLDVLKPIRGVLLRFRSGLHAALGEKCTIVYGLKIRMSTSIVFSEATILKRRLRFSVFRINIGDIPAGCIAQVAIRETANLPQFSKMVERSPNVA